MNNARQQQIQDFIQKNQVVTIKQLHALCPEVSLMTIHRDLDQLEQGGGIVKFRGGARSVHHSSDIGFDIRLQENVEGKRDIAMKALDLIRPNSTIFLDSGTTNLIFARNLPDIPLNIFTTGPNIAMELCRLTKPNITLCSGVMSRKNLALSGPNTVEMLEKINLDIAFIGVSGCLADAGFTCGTEADMVVKQAAIRRARCTVAMCDRDKFTRLMPYTFAKFSDVDYLIADGDVPESVAIVAKEQNVTVL